jgi:hypothetical protein
MLDHRNLFSSAQARDCSEIHEHLRELGLDATSLDNSELLVASELVYLARSSGTNALAQLASAYAMFDLMDRGQSTDTSIPEELSWTKRGLRILEEAHQVCYSEERSAKKFLLLLSVLPTGLRRQQEETLIPWRWASS